MSGVAIRRSLEGDWLRTLGAPGWHGALIRLAIMAAAFLLLFHRDAIDMVGIWLHDSTFAHCILIPPILVWLVEIRRRELSFLKPVAWWPGLVWLGGAGFCWLIGEAAGVALLRQLALILMLQGAVLSLLGPNVARALLFPLGYAFFMVPFGDGLIQPMQTLTAQMTMPLLALTGIPAHIEGIFISTATGYFKVAEACAGVNFLIAMAAFAVLAANLCFRSWGRRIAFMALAIVIPVLANGVRAWGTIFIAHHSGVDFAAGFDHIFYGWIFFAVVLAVVIGISWPFFDRRADAAPFAPEDYWGEVKTRAAPLPMLAIALSLALLPVGWSALSRTGGEPLPARIEPGEVPGWTQIAYEPLAEWKPHYSGADRERIARYRGPDGAMVDVYVAAYSRQEEGRELVGFGQGAVDPDSDWAWMADTLPYGPMRGSRIRNPAPVLREVATAYYLDGRLIHGDIAVKLATLKTKLLGGDQRAAVLILSAEAREGRSARKDIEAFLAAFEPLDPRFATMVNDAR